MWILDRCNNRICHYLPDGAAAGHFGQRMTLDEEERRNDPVDELRAIPCDSSVERGFNYPLAFVREPGGEFLVADTGNRRIVRISLDGTFSNIVPLDAGEPPLFHPVALALLPDGGLLVESVDRRLLLLHGSNFCFATPIELVDRNLTTAFLVGPGTQAGAIAGYQGDNILNICHLPEPEGGTKPPLLPEPIESINLADIEKSSRCLGTDYVHGLTSEKVQDFLRRSIQVSQKSLQRLADIETQYCAEVIAHFAAVTTAERNGEPPDGLTGSIHSSKVAEARIKVIMRGAERRGARRMFVKALSMPVRLLTLLPPALRESTLKGAVADYRNLLAGEFEARKNDYEQTIGLLKEKLADIATLDTGIVLHGLLGVIFLHDYMRVAVECLQWLDGDETPEALPPLPVCLAPYRTYASEHEMLPRNALELFARLSYEWGAYDAADAILKTLANSPDPVIAKRARWLGLDTTLALNRIDKAVDVVRNELAADPGFIEHASRAAYHSLSVGRFSCGIMIADLIDNAAVDHEKTSADTAMIRAMAMAHRCSYLSAQALLKKFASFLPPAFIRQIESVVALAGPLDESLERLSRMVADWPDEPGPRLQMAIAQALAGDFDAAVATLDEETRRWPSVSCSYVRVMIERLRGAFSDAIVEGAGSPDLFPGVPSAAVECVVAAMAVNDEPRIVALLTELNALLESHPGWYGILYFTEDQQGLVSDGLQKIAASSDRYRVEKESFGPRGVRYKIGPPDFDPEERLGQ